MEQDPNDAHTVVVNDEEQYSLWPVGAACPPGWRPVGVSGSRRQCLDWIAVNWTDQRPRSLRERLSAKGPT
ncbi:MbtH family NRPS accessory protein [Nocardiopsis sp. YSL2]|uniref:MbtH family protein n=1 Tax=Nocardiopsis sp. YSL2 TaxID=2939492 RepID=UPI0026F471B6|nr:MbtH family NRPS accessory protein [Nocardiopsis sp. YSL2]